MNLIKTAKVGLMAAAGLALLSGYALAQNSSYTYTTNTSGNVEQNSFEGAASTTNFTLTHTEGDAIAIAIATPIGVASGGGSEAGGSTNNGAGGTTNTQNGETFTVAFNHTHLWAEVSHQEAQGTTGTSGTGGTGNSLATLFVFGQTTAVSENGDLEDNSPIAPVVSVGAGDFNNSTGYIALNQVAGVGNQQGNALATVAELSGANGTTAGSNSINTESNQTLAVAGEIDNNYGSGGESATISPGTFQGVTGAIAFNQAAGVANQQANTMILGK